MDISILILALNVHYSPQKSSTTALNNPFILFLHESPYLDLFK